MKQENKQLLFKDLCARLPYKPIVHAKWSYREINGELKHKESDRELEINDIYAIWDIKPYLRPMSSMTEEEHMKLKAVYDNGSNGLLDEYSHIDWLLSHYFDFRGLIEKGLAIEAKEGMYKTE